MKLVCILLTGLLLLATAPFTALRAQNSPTASTAAYQYLQMTTIESVVAGGIGRSRVLFTPSFKGTKEAQMENLFSLTGINIKNVQNNEEIIVRYLGEITADGWELIQTVPLTQTLTNAGSTNQGIFLTRYMFRKPR